MRYLKRVLLFTACVYSCVLVDIHSFAQETSTNTSFTIYPAIIDLDVEPENDYTQKITFENNLNIPVPTTIEVIDYTVDENGTPIYNQDITGWSPKDWIALDQSDIIVDGDESRDITLLITVPKQAKPGSHFASIMFQPVLPEDYYDPKSSHVVPYIGGIIALNVITEGTERKTDYLGVENFRNSLTKKNPEEVTFSAELLNDDIYYHKVIGTIHIYNMFGIHMTEVPVTDTTLFPQNVRNISETLKDNLMVGKYRAVLTIEGENTKKTANESFWVPPNTLEISIMIIGSLLTLLVMYRVVRALYTRLQKQTP